MHTDTAFPANSTAAALRAKTAELGATVETLQDARTLADSDDLARREARAMSAMRDAARLDMAVYRLAEVVDEGRTHHLIETRDLMDLIEEAPGDHPGLATWLRCGRRGLPESKSDEFLADLLADLRAEVAG